MSVSWDREKYPYLSLLDNSDLSHVAEANDEETMQTHFTSMLSYIQDHDDILSMMGQTTDSPNRYQDMINFVQKNGLKIHGFAVSAKKKALLELYKEDVVSYIELWLNNVNVQPEINQDNEMRNLSVSALLKLNVKLYKETSIKVIEDVYKLGANLVPIMESKTYQKLLVKNASRTKEVVKMKIDKTKGQLLQICNSQAEIKIENILVRDNSLKAIGKIKTCIIYISSDDRHPICCQCRESNFEHGIDAEGIEGNDEYFLNWKVEQVNANMLNADEVEIKAVIALEAIVFKKVEQNFVTEINQEPVDMEALNSAPVLKGYIVQKGDTLWKLAKENYTTIEKIMTVNNLENETIKKGDRLLIIKSCQA